MNCQEVTRLIPDYLTGELSKTQDIGLRAHFEECPACQAEASSLADLWHGLGHLPDERPSGELRSRFYKMLEAYQAGLDQAKAGPGWLTRLNDGLAKWWPGQPAYQLALTGAVLIVGLVIGMQMATQTTGDHQMQALSQEVTELRNLVTVSLLQQRSASDRLMGLSYSHRVQEPDARLLDALFDALDNDSNVNVRLAAADAISPYTNQAVVRARLIQSLARQQSPFMQVTLIDLLVAIRERESVEALRQMIRKKSIDQTVRLRAEWGIEQLS